MSGRLVGEVLKYAPTDLRMLDRFVLVALAEAASPTDRTARFKVTQDHLADKLQSTPSSIRNALMRLRQRALIIPLFEKPRKGLAQNWRIAPLNEGTRRAANGAPRKPPKTSPTEPISDIPGTDAVAKGLPVRAPNRTKERTP